MTSNSTPSAWLEVLNTSPMDSWIEWLASGDIVYESGA